MMRDFYQTIWNSELEEDLQRLIELAFAEDRRTIGDLTSTALIPPSARGCAVIHARQQGVLAGMPGIPLIMRCFDTCPFDDRVDDRLTWKPACEDGREIVPGDRIGEMSGPAAALLGAERLVLNFLGRLSGIATLTRRYVDLVRGTHAQIYDTRKTTLGWRRLEKYAVRCGGGRNHRTGLYDAVLIKDNHLAFGGPGDSGSTSFSKTPSSSKTGVRFTPAEAVRNARNYLTERFPPATRPGLDGPLLEIEVDTLEQLKEVLPANPDLVLLDNMSPAMLREAVAIRNASVTATSENRTPLEASGGVNLETLRAIAESGVDRISVGALTHSAVSLDFGLDWSYTEAG